MVADWDYGAAAAVFDARPAYHASAVDGCLAAMALPDGSRACDVGAGTGRLTVALLARGLDVVAVEPNARMRAGGVANTLVFPAARWIGGRAEHLPLADCSCRLVSFGSSFNVVDRTAALREAARVLLPGGALLCVWNHRRLDDPLQARIEALIRAHVPEFAYGTRREDQSAIIAANGCFRAVQRIERAHEQRVGVARWMAAWGSHLTLRRQAGARFATVLAAIGELVAAVAADGAVTVPYVTRAWVAERAR